MPTLSGHSAAQAQVWLRGLLSMAWADGHYDPEEKALIETLLHDDLQHMGSLAPLEPISPQELAESLDPQEGENFLRIVVMVGLADGVYSASEAALLEAYAEALGVTIPGLAGLQSTLVDLAPPLATDPPSDQNSDQSTHQSTHQSIDPPPDQPTNAAAEPPSSSLSAPDGDPDKHDLLHPLRHWLDGVEVNNPKVARFLCKMIPSQCPFERDVVLFNRKIFHIPPMCKLNPLYDQVVGLRFRALSFLADTCHEDVRPYL